MVFDILMNVLRVTICCVVFACCLMVPLRTRFRYGALKMTLIALLTVVMTVGIVVLFLTPDQFFSDYSSLGICLWLAGAILIYHMAVKGSFYEVLFVVLVILNLYVNVVAIAKIVISVIPLPFPAEAARTLATTAVLILYLPLLWLLMIRLYKRVIEFSVDFLFWRFIWVIPALCYMVYYVKIINDYWKHPVQTGTGDILFIILWSFTSYTLFCITLQMIIQTYEGMNAKAEAAILAAQVKVQGNQYERLLDNIETTARLRHDWRHHLLSINSYVEHGDLDGLRDYMKELLPAYMTDSGAPICANYIANAILQHHAVIAKATGVEMRITANIRKLLSVSDTDLCIVLGNLVENAVEAAGACTGEKLVEIKAEMQGRQMILLIRNTYSGRISVRDGVYFSTKHDGIGIGISSVKKVVEKNQGIMRMEYDGKIFTVYILLNAG